MCKKFILLSIVVLLIFLTGKASAALQIYYPLDETDGTTAEDFSGNGYDANVVGTWTDVAVFGGALDLSGDGYIDVTGFTPGAAMTDFTFMAWMRNDAWPDYAGIWSNGDSLRVSGGMENGGMVEIVFRGDDPLDQWYVAYPENDWIHVAVARAGTSIKLYWDGEFKGERTLGEDPDYSVFQVGNSSQGEPMNAIFDEVGIWDEALDSTTINEYRNGGIPGAITYTATNPSPVRNAENVCPGTPLSWSAGDLAAQHDVYFGTDYNSVRDANTVVQLGVYVDRRGTTSYAPSLDMGVTYYWRIDEVNDANLWKGSVWQFSTNDGNAFDFYPSDGEIIVPVDAGILYWEAGCGADSHDVYLGTDYNEVADANSSLPAGGIYKGNQTYNYFFTDTYDYLTTYYWRIDEHDGSSIFTGKVLRFTTRPAVFDPNLLVWYKFDETSGNVAEDSSGHEYHGEVEGASDGWDANDAFDGASRVFDNDTGIAVPGDITNNIYDRITVAVWVKTDVPVGDDMTVLDIGPARHDSLYKITAVVPDENGDVVWRAGNGEDNDPDANDVLVWAKAAEADYSGEWHHYAFIKDEIADEMRIYRDAEVVADSNQLAKDLANIWGTTMRIGAYTQNSSDYSGKLDEFRLYNRILTDQEILTLLRGSDLGVAWAPSPRNGAVDVGPDADLTWRPGDYAGQHRVFFGESWDDVNSMTDPCVTKSVGDEIYDPGTLRLNTTYYWRVDEVNDPCVWKGPVWRFKVADFIILDDFESYDKSSNLIYYTWYCKQAMPYGDRSGAYFELSTSPAHTGEKALKYNYETDDSLYWDQDYAYSDACLPLDEIGGFQDWASVDVRLLTVFFYGQAGNDANDTEQMYMAVHNASGNYAEVRYGDHPGEDMNDLKVEEWQRWDVPFVWFTDSNAAVSANVDFSAISSVYLGFGDKRNPIRAGNGVAYFDDLRLSMPICKPEYGPMGDLSGDCFVGVADIGEIADQWLRGDVNVNPVSVPSDANLVGHWELDGDANDSSGNAYHGAAQGAYTWVTGKVGSGAIELDGGKVVVGDGAKLRPAHQISAAAWINYSEATDYSARVLVKGIDANDNENFAIELGGGTPDFFVRDVNHGLHSVEGDEIVQGEWAHLAGTYDGNSVKCYVNGQLSNSDAIGEVTTLLQDTNDLAIGNRTDATDRAFIGTVDDVRIYDRALTRAEVAYLAAGPTGLIPLESEANFYSGEDPEVINFRDFARLFDYWGDEQLWPLEPAP